MFILHNPLLPGSTGDKEYVKWRGIIELSMRGDGQSTFSRNRFSTRGYKMNLPARFYSFLIGKRGITRRFQENPT